MSNEVPTPENVQPVAPEKGESLAAAHVDGYANIFSKLSLPADKNLGDFFMPDRTLQPQELAIMYEQDAMCARIVNRLVDDATRTKFTLKGIDESYDFESVQSELDDLNALPMIGDAWRWGRLYGGGLVIMAINDGRKYDQPLDLGGITRVSGLNVLDSSTCWPRDWIPRLGSRAFGDPRYYEITVPFVGGAMKSVHASRVIRIDGSRVPPSRLLMRNGWPPSVLQRVWREVTQLGKAMGYSANLLNEMSLMVLMIDGWRQMICGGPGQQGQAEQMLYNFKFGADNLHLLALDKKDDFKEVKRSADGVALLLEKFVEALVRATDMPRLILLGEQPGGLNADAKGEVRAWYDYVASQQQQILTPALNRVLTILFAARAKKGEKVPTEWTIEYESLYPTAPETQASTLQSYATAASTLITSGVATPREIRAQLMNLNLISPVDGEIDTTQLAANQSAANTAPTETKAEPPDVKTLTDLAAAVQSGSLQRSSGLAILKAAYPSLASVAELILPEPPPPVEEVEVAAGDEEGEELEVSSHAPPPGETLMSPKEIGAALGVGPAAIKAMHKRGEIDGWLIGRRFRYSLSQVQAAAHRPGNAPNEDDPDK